MSDSNKVVVTRNVGQEALDIIEKGLEGFEVRSPFSPNKALLIFAIQIVLWPENSQAPRNWVLENIPGARGILLLITDPINQELLDAGECITYLTTHHRDLPESRSKSESCLYYVSRLWYAFFRFS